jgi:hypothetical protein
VICDNHQVIHYIENPNVSHSVDDRHSVPLIHHQTRLTQNGKVLRDIRLRAGKHVREMHDVGPFLTKQRKDTKPHRMRKSLGQPRSHPFVFGKCSIETNHIRNSE